MTSDQIQALVAELSEAIWQRSREDSTFDLYVHLTHPDEYHPVTRRELDAWEALTSPLHYDALFAYVTARRSGDVSLYAATMDHLVLQAAQERRTQQETDRGQTPPCPASTRE
jgi:hypothetical protein